MTNTLRRILALTLAVLMILALAAGCKPATQDDGTNDTKNPSGTNDTPGENNNNSNNSPEFVFKAEYSPMPVDGWINALSYGGEMFVFVGEEVTGARRDFYDENWNYLGYIDIPLDQVGQELGYVTSDGNLNPYDGGETDDVPTDEPEDTPPAEGETEGEDGKRYCEELDIYYTYSSDYEMYGQVIYKMSVDGSTTEKLPDYTAPAIMEGKLGDTYVQNLVIDNEGCIWISESGSTYHYDENNNYVWDGEVISLRKLSNTGAELFAVDTAAMMENTDYLYFNDMVIDEQNNLILSDGSNNRLYVFDTNGVQKQAIELGDQWISNLVVVDKVVYAQYYSETSEVLAPIDLTTGQFGEEIPMPNNAYNTYAGGGEYDLYYNDQINFYGFNLGDEIGTPIVNWIDSDIDSNYLRYIFPREDGTILAASQNYNSSSGNVWELVTFTKVPASEVPQETVITLACVYLDYNLRSAIIDFNKANDEYRIKVTDYSMYNTSDDYNAGRTKLSTEIMSGIVPDIIMTQNLPANVYQNKGLLEDLLPYIQNDAEISDDVLMDAFKPLITDDGKLYSIADSFYFETLVGASAVVGDIPGWTMKDLEAAMLNMPEGASAFGPEMTRGNLINDLCRMMQEDYIDWTTGECNFTSQEFKDFLAYIKTYPEEINWDEYYGDDYNWETDSVEALVSTGRVMLTRQYMSDFWSYQYLQAMFRNKPFTFIGFPSQNGKGTIIGYNNACAMSSTCQNKDAAWQFMRTLLTYEYQTQNVWQYRINKTAWEEELEGYMTPYTYIDENGNEVVQPNLIYVVGEEIDVGYLKQEHVDHVLDMLNYAVPETAYDEKIYNIILEESAHFFSGQKTVDDVCDIIQSRIKIYVSENM